MDRIILPNFLIADLYKDCLVDLDTFSSLKEEFSEKKLPEEAQIPFDSALGIKYLGQNRRRITVLINDALLTDLNKDDLIFLTSVLKACGLSIEDIAIVNVAKQPITFTEIKEQLLALQVILFDVEPSFIKLPFIIPTFQVQKYADTTIMLAPALSSLNKPPEESKVLKTKLWNSLKQLFGLK